MTAGLVVTGLAHLVTAWALVPARRAGRALLAAGGVATLAVAAVPLPSRTESSVGAHRRRRALLRAPRASGRGSRPGPAGPSGPRARGSRGPRPSVMALAVASLGLALRRSGLRPARTRRRRSSRCAWPLVTAVGTWWWAGHRIGSRRVRHVLAVVGLTVACGVAGVCATAVAPVTAETRHYQSSVSLDPNPCARRRARGDDGVRRHRGRVHGARARHPRRPAGQGQHRRRAVAARRHARDAAARARRS